MIPQVFNCMMTVLLAKFMFNDVPHAIGLTDPASKREPSPGQLRYIAVLTQRLQMTEIRVVSFGEAGRLIRELETEEKYRKRIKVAVVGKPTPTLPPGGKEITTPEPEPVPELGEIEEYGNPGTVVRCWKCEKLFSYVWEDTFYVERKYWVTCPLCGTRVNAQIFFTLTPRELEAARDRGETIHHKSSNPGGLFRTERTTVDKRIVDALEQTWHRIESDTSFKMQSSLNILKSIMGYHYEEPVVVAWKEDDLIGAATYSVFVDHDTSRKYVDVSELASFSYIEGVGHALVSEVIAIAKEENSHAVILKHAPGTRQFYEGIGFVLELGVTDNSMIYHIGGNPGTAADRVEYPEHFYRCWNCGQLFVTSKWVKVRGREGLECPYCSAFMHLYAAYLTDRERDWHREQRTPIPDAGIQELPPTGTCYPDAWRYLMREESGFLVHGSVQLTKEGKRVNHAWVELPTGYIWEPQTGSYFTVDGFRIFSPIEEHRYTVEEAAIMLAKTSKHGPWTAGERTVYIGR